MAMKEYCEIIDKWCYLTKKQCETIEAIKYIHKELHQHMYFTVARCSVDRETCQNAAKVYIIFSV